MNQRDHPTQKYLHCEKVSSWCKYLPTPNLEEINHSSLEKLGVYSPCNKSPCQSFTRHREGIFPSKQELDSCNNDVLNIAVVISVVSR